MKQRIAPSVQIEAAIEAVLAGGLAEPDALSSLGRLGAQLVLQRAVEDEVAAFLRRARYERTSDATGSRNGHRPRPVQTAEGEITVAMPQVRGTLTRFVSQVIPDTRSMVRTRPLEALVIGALLPAALFGDDPAGVRGDGSAAVDVDGSRLNAEGARTSTAALVPTDVEAQPGAPGDPYRGRKGVPGCARQELGEQRLARACWCRGPARR